MTNFFLLLINIIFRLVYILLCLSCLIMWLGKEHISKRGLDLLEGGRRKNLTPLMKGIIHFGFYWVKGVAGKVGGD